MENGCPRENQKRAESYLTTKSWFNLMLIHSGDFIYLTRLNGKRLLSIAHNKASISHPISSMTEIVLFHELSLLSVLLWNISLEY